MHARFYVRVVQAAQGACCCHQHQPTVALPTSECALAGTLHTAHAPKAYTPLHPMVATHPSQSDSGLKSTSHIKAASSSQDSPLDCPLPLRLTHTTLPPALLSIAVQVNRLLAHTGGKVPYLMHRLDVETSGLLLFGKVPEVVPDVMRQFRWAGLGGTAGWRICMCTFVTATVMFGLPG